MQVHRRQVTLIEQANGRWLHAQYGTTYKTLASALRTLKQQDSRIATSIGGAVITTREVIANSAVGKLVARTLTAA